MEAPLTAMNLGGQIGCARLEIGNSAKDLFPIIPDLLRLLRAKKS
jgi:hypothetical protein